MDTFNQNTYNNITNNKIRTGSDPLDNDTYTECYNAHENNNDERLEEIIHLWKKTNFWLGCIGTFFLICLIFLLLSIFIKLGLGIKFFELFLQ